MHRETAYKNSHLGLDQDSDLKTYKLSLLENLVELTLGRLGLWLLNLSGSELLLGESLGVRVQSQENLLVLERVLLQDVRTLLGRLASWSDNGLHLSRVDQSGDVSVGDDVLWKRVSRFGLVDRLQSGKGRLGPDDESTEMSTWSELQQVEGSHVAGLDTWDVSESLDKTLVLVVDNQRTSSLNKSSVSHLTLTGTHLLGFDNLDNVAVGSDRLEQRNSLLGLGDGLNVVGNDKWDLWDLFNSVTSGEDKRLNGRSSNGRSGGVTLLIVVHLDVPLSPDLGGGKHTTGTTHVTESSLTGTVSTTTTDTWNTGNGTTGTPRLSRGLVTSLGGDGVSLSLVLVHSGENRVDNIGTDGCAEDSWKSNLRGRWLSLGGDDANLGACGHFGGWCFGWMRNFSIFFTDGCVVQG